MRKTFTYDGKRYYVERKTKSELDRAVEQKKAELREGKVKESNITFKEYAYRWFRLYKSPFVSSATKYSYIASIKTWCENIGATKLKCVSPEDLQRVINAQYDMGVSKSKTDKLILTIRQIYRQAVSDRFVVYNPTTTIQKPKTQETSRTALTECQYRLILDRAKEHEYGDIILTILYLGLRPMEVSLLTAGDFTNTYVHVRGTKSKKADRYVVRPEALILDLRGKSDTDMVFVNKKGKSLTRDDLRRIWASFKEGLDLDGVTLYTLRHTYGTRAQKAGVPIDVLADLMGHEKIETTRKYYIDDNLESKERQRAKLNSMWT